VSELTLKQLAKDFELLRPAITDHMITAVVRQISQPQRYSVEGSEMRAYLQWRLKITSKQLDAVLLGCFVAAHADELHAEQNQDQR
jgi:hypothetical protein